jgi:GNAT superfamily N-acetyltransferase
MDPARASETGCNAMSDPVTVHPLTAERWPDLQALFESRGCSVARWCWCMYYRVNAAQWKDVPEGMTKAERNRAALKWLSEQQTPPGLIAYRGGAPVGWVALGPRAHFARLANSQAMAPVDDQPVWSVVCFVVPPAHRGQGVAHALLKAAVRHAKAQGAALLEGYPIDKPQRSNAEDIWHGTKSMFDAAGFGEAARRKPQRPVMRLRLE